MLTQNQIDGGWNELKGKIKETWGRISDDELREFEGDVQQLVGLIQRGTGEAREDIERRLQELDDQFRPYFAQAYETARQYAQQTAATANEAADRVRENLSAGHEEARQMVRSRPMESVAVAFGAGLVAGVIVGLVARSR